MIDNGKVWTHSYARIADGVWREITGEKDRFYFGRPGTVVHLFGAKTEEEIEADFRRDVTPL